MKTQRLHKLLAWTVSLMMVFLCATDMAYAKKKRKRRRWKTITHKVRRGETLSKIAKKYRTTPAKIKRWNKKVKPSKMRIGQKLRIVVSARSRYARGGNAISKAVVPKKLETISPEEMAFYASVAGPTEVSPTLEKPPKEIDVPEDLANIPVIVHPSEVGEVKDAVYISQFEDNVGTVALKFGLDTLQLMEWNELTSLNFEPGTPLRLKFNEKPKLPEGPVPVVHRVGRRDTFKRIARRYGVSIKKIRRWNRRVNPRRLRKGQKIKLYVTPKHGFSTSIGKANRGRLYNGVPLSSTHGLKVHTVAFSYGTERVVRLIKAAAADVKARWPDSSDLVVGDISYRNGGRMKRHKSHQSGRDADITYYIRGNVQLPDFRGMNYDSFDAVKNWHLFKTWIDAGVVEYIFVDYALQKILYQYALSLGYSKAELEPIFQYPRPRSNSVGLIRHTRGHRDHFHIRFVCGPLDTRCR